MGFVVHVSNSKSIERQMDSINKGNKTKNYLTQSRFTLFVIGLCYFFSIWVKYYKSRENINLQI